MPKTIFVVLTLLGFASTSTTALGVGEPGAWNHSVQNGRYDLAVNQALQGSENSQNDLARLIHQASEKQLHTLPMWHALMHYQSTFGGVKSQVDSPWFFQSENGKTDSQAELNATLAAFFHDSAKAPLRLSAYCRFIARRHWLEQELGSLWEVIPTQSCPESAQFQEYLDAHTLTLVFPTSHPNSPASAFGHTLLRVDKKDQSIDSKLLNMSINFSAEVPVSVSPLAYAFGGINGRFPGVFQLLPYHVQLREYRQIDNRDTWEYELRLTQSQVDTIIRHSYEMLIARFDYYFFSENCSYHLLGLLDVAFAGDPLADVFSLWTIPVDTIKVLHKRELLKKQTFVPSTIRTLKQREKNLSPKELNLALQAAEFGIESVASDIETLPDQRAALVLDTISDYSRYKRYKTDNSASGLNETERAVLSRRSKLGIRTEAPGVPVPNLAPQLGHETSRLTLRAEKTGQDQTRWELTYRAAYHDLRDPSTSYGTQAAIEMFKLSVAHDSNDKKPFISRLTLINIDSIEPRRGFFKPWSWRTRVGWERKTADSSHRFAITGGVGAAYRSQTPASPVVFAFAEGDFLDDPALPQRASIQLGSRLGVHWEPKRAARFGIEWTHRELIGSRRYDSGAELWASLSPTRNSAFVLNASRQRISGKANSQSFGIEWRLFF